MTHVQSDVMQVLLTLLTAYGSAAMGQLFFFHVVLIKKVASYFSILLCHVYFLIAISTVLGVYES